MTGARAKDGEWFLVCSLDDAFVRLCRSYNSAHSLMEAPDIDAWRVFDSDLFVRQLNVVRHWGEWVSIGGRLGDAPAGEDARARVQAYLRLTRPEGAWDEATMDSLLEALEEVNHTMEAETLRRMRKVKVAVVGIALGVAALWWFWRG